MTTYDVTVTREDGMWVTDIDGLTAATDVPRFHDLDTETRDLIAGLTDVEPNSFELHWRYVFDDADVSAFLTELQQVEDALAAAEAQRDQARRQLSKAGKQAGLSERVIADVIGVSHQRVNQLVRAR